MTLHAHAKIFEKLDKFDQELNQPCDCPHCGEKTSPAECGATLFRTHNLKHPGCGGSVRYMIGFLGQNWLEACNDGNS